MENKEFANESNLPEEGAKGVNKVVENSEQVESVNQTEETIEPVKQADETIEEFDQSEASVSEDLELDEKLEATVDKPVEKNEELEQSEDVDVEDKSVPNVVGKDNKEDVLYKDYSKFEKPELLTKLNSLINNYKIELIREAVEDIKLNFYKKHKIEVAEARKKFEEEGGNLEDFKFSGDSSEDTFKVLYGQFRDKKSILIKNQEAEKKKNIIEKYSIIEEINVLINKEESINKTFQEFRELQNRWRDAGLVPQNEVKNLWENYNHTVEKFYDYVKINKELRDLDLKNNLELKIKLCENAEALLLDDSITKAFKTLQDYHHKWREIGPVPREQKDDLWDRFKAATTQINKKHQEYFEGLKEQQVNNLEQKVVLCEKIEELLTDDLLKPKDWEVKADKIIELQKLWRTIGFAPKKDNNKIYQRFKTACDSFFAKKRDFYKDAKEVQKDNLQLKLDLCVQAESLKDSTEWRKSTEDFIRLQKRWKEIGPVPKKHSEPLWKRFRTSCDHFFTMKSEFYNTVDSRQEENLKLKLELIEKVKTFEKAETEKENLTKLMAIQKEWTDVGHVPLNQKDEITKAFRDAINEQFEVLKIDVNERNKLNYKSKVEGWASSNSRSKIYSERNKLINKIKELENEILLYENNIGFFSKSSKSNAMVDEIKKKIEKTHERIVEMKSKLRLLDSADKE